MLFILPTRNRWHGRIWGVLFELKGSGFTWNCQVMSSESSAHFPCTVALAAVSSTGEHSGWRRLEHNAARVKKYPSGAKAAKIWNALMFWLFLIFRVHMGSHKIAGTAYSRIPTIYIYINIWYVCVLCTHSYIRLSSKWAVIFRIWDRMIMLKADAVMYLQLRNVSTVHHFHQPLQVHGTSATSTCGTWQSDSQLWKSHATAVLRISQVLKDHGRG